MRSPLIIIVLLISISIFIISLYHKAKTDDLNNEKKQMLTFFHACEKTGMTQTECEFEWIKENMK